MTYLDCTAIALTRLSKSPDAESSAPHPYPVVVIDNFLNGDEKKGKLITDQLSEWAAVLVENKVAHVIFVSDNPSVARNLGKGKNYCYYHFYYYYYYCLLV